GNAWPNCWMPMECNRIHECSTFYVRIEFGRWPAPAAAGLLSCRNGEIDLFAAECRGRGPGPYRAAAADFGPRPAGARLIGAAGHWRFVVLGRQSLDFRSATAGRRQ